jgi:glutamyl-tRNA synthetase
MAMSGPVLRFAPSPTGFFHVGGARTVLWNWLLARQQGGTLILRIEDTDHERNKEEWVDGIRSAIAWLGLDWDVDVRQSDRASLYDNAIAKLVAGGFAYFCDCASEDVVARNVAAMGKAAERAGYDGFCRDRGLERSASTVVRFRAPQDGTTTVPDVIRGNPVFENSTIEDFVLARKDGSAVFLLANVVDDIDMGVTHVVRGEEHLPNTPKAVLLWHALAPSTPLPVFAHVAVLVNEQRQKLSKRRDKVAMESYRDMGILAEAMRAYLCVLGWMPKGEREQLTVPEMIEQFRLEDVSPSPAFFDVVKLTAFNADHIRALSVDEFVERAMPFITIEGVTAESFRPIAPLVQQRCKLLTEISDQIDFFFAEPTVDADSWDKVMTKGRDVAVAMLDGVTVAIKALEPVSWNHDALKATVETVGAANDLKLGKAQAPIRVALTGRTVGPPLFESMEILGRDVVLSRLGATRAQLEAQR